MRIVIVRIVLDQKHNIFNFVTDDLFLITGTTDSISVNSYYVGQAFVLFNVGFEALFDEVLDDD